MDTRFFDMLEDAGHNDINAVPNRIDVHFNGIAQIAVDEHRRVA